MTVQREEIRGTTVLVATCDQPSCSERLVLDELDPDCTKGELTDFLHAKGWDSPPPERLPSHWASRGPRPLFWNDSCPDCQLPGARPTPKRGSGRKAMVHVAMDDPVDEWPRNLIWKAAGLREACGHPVGDGPICQPCRDGQPIGTMRPGWQR